jgi:hypothetical protein
MLHRILPLRTALLAALPAIPPAALPADVPRASPAVPAHVHVHVHTHATESREAPARDVLSARCIACHDADGPAPIRLDSLEAVLRHRRLMRALVEDRSMPPGGVEGPHATVDAARTGRGMLDDRERAALLDALASEERARRAFEAMASSPTQPAAPSVARVTTGGAWTVPATGGMRIRSFHAPLAPDAPTRIRGWRMVAPADPARSPIRFISLAPDPARAWRILDERGTGAEAMGDVGRTPSGALGALSRTAPEFALPDGFAFELPAGDLVIETTLEPIGRESLVRPSIEMLAATPGDVRTVRAIAARIMPLEVAAGERVERVVHIEAAEPLALVGIVAKGGAYLRGYAVDAIAADGCRTTIARDRDFRMNLTAPLVFREPPPLAKGVVIEVRFDLDNTRANPLQPFDPPRALVAGLPPEGEDAAVILLVAPVEPAAPIPGGRADR